jgi:hypothetical protein
MGMRHIENPDCPSFDNYECDNCGESALVLAGSTPAGWYEEYKFLPNAEDIEFNGQFYCPQCRKAKEE